MNAQTHRMQWEWTELLLDSRSSLLEWAEPQKCSCHENLQFGTSAENWKFWLIEYSVCQKMLKIGKKKDLERVGEIGLGKVNLISHWLAKQARHFDTKCSLLNPILDTNFRLTRFMGLRSIQKSLNFTYLPRDWNIFAEVVWENILLDFRVSDRMPKMFLETSWTMKGIMV